MIAGLEARGRALAEAARRRTIARLAARLRGEAPELRIEENATGVTVTGRRATRDPRLIWIGSLFR